MRVAYLTSTYPAVSHTFIRRELTALERELGPIARFAIRATPHGIVDADDEEEDGQTFRLLEQPLGRWVRAVARRGLARPFRALRGLSKCVELASEGHRGWLRHFAYYAEALLLLDELARRGIDHVHVHFGTNPTAVAEIARAMGGPPYSFTVHGPDEFDAPEGFAIGTKIVDSSFVVAISHYCAAQLQRWVHPTEWHKIRVVGCGVGDEFFSAGRPIDPKSRALVCVGRLTPQKGQVLLLEAFAEAIARGVDAELVLVGDGELRSELERVIERRQLSKHVRITGWVDGATVRKELLAARALVLPSSAEGLPVVIMEAFALGRPVLSTFVAAIPELVKDGESGWLVPAGSKEDLVRAIVDISEAPVSELERRAAKGREAVRRDHYTPTEAAKLAAHLRRTHGTPVPVAMDVEGESESELPPRVSDVAPRPALPRLVPSRTAAIK